VAPTQRLGPRNAPSTWPPSLRFSYFDRCCSSDLDRSNRSDPVAGSVTLTVAVRAAA